MTTDALAPAGVPATLGRRQLFVDGGFSDSADGATYDVIEPATGTRLAQVARAGGDDVEIAVAAARSAFEDGDWSTMSARVRGQILIRAAHLMREHAEELAELESRDCGKPITFTRMIDVPTMCDTFEYYGSLAAGLEGASRPIGADTLAYTRQEPMGVVAAITPFNFPLILSSTKLAPALAAGNTVVHKPADETPLSALRVAELLTEAGVPAGALNVLTGDGSVGEALVGHGAVAKVAFTGSTAVGRKVAELAGRTLKPVTVELGGKSANIIFDDADLEAAIQTAIQAFVFNTGQFCMAGSRLLVQRGVYDAVLGALEGALPHVPVGDPADPGTVIGPMAGPKHLAKVSEFLDAAAGAGITIGGRGASQQGDNGSGRSGGLYVQPALLADVSQDSPFVQQEIFGPVLTVQPFDTEEQAVKLANGTAYALAAGVQTTSLSRAHRIAAQLRAGIVWVNGWAKLDVAMPFGGSGDSGHGVENGPEGLREYLRTKSVVVAL
jgi:acyl-CoA reductase-like NAD-dependent aldehyde dehydrogenase